MNLNNLNRINLDRKDRLSKMRWIRKNIHDYDRLEHIHLGPHRVLVAAYLDDQELAVYRLIFGK